jgi:hypothetical protein
LYALECILARIWLNVRLKQNPVIVPQWSVWGIIREQELS